MANWNTATAKDCKYEEWNTGTGQKTGLKEEIIIKRILPSDNAISSTAEPHRTRSTHQFPLLLGSPAMHLG